jgi:hypothetical protein
VARGHCRGLPGLLHERQLDCPRHLAVFTASPSRGASRSSAPCHRGASVADAAVGGHRSRRLPPPALAAAASTTALLPRRPGTRRRRLAAARRKISFVLELAEQERPRELLVLLPTRSSTGGRFRAWAAELAARAHGQERRSPLDAGCDRYIHLGQPVLGARAASRGGAAPRASFAQRFLERLSSFFFCAWRGIALYVSVITSLPSLYNIRMAGLLRLKRCLLTHRQLIYGLQGSAEPVPNGCAAPVSRCPLV